MHGRGQVAWRSIVDRLQDRAARAPTAVAIEGVAGELTYAAVASEVERRAALIARRLGGREPLVAVCLERTLDLPLWLLAILAARAAYLPLDATLPPARTARVLDDARPGLILASAACLPVLPAIDLPLVVAEDLAAETAPAGAPLPLCAPDDLAYVIYTSGSTGQPKGVEIEHRAITALIDAIVESPGLAAGERMLASTRISFDMSVLELFLPFAVGARMVMIGLDDAVDPRRLGALLERFQPDVMQATPAAYRALLEAGWPAFAPPRLLCGGEAMTPDLAQRLLPRCGALWNVYGPTETTVWSTAHHVTAPTAPVAIGHPIAGTTVELLDGDARAVADGDIGEIAIGGPSVARGYRDAPALTADRFVALADGRRVYRTGDLGRRDADGLLVCLGRLDDQVKVRGFRVELGDVESALAEHPEVAWGAVRAWPDRSGETALVGYVVTRGDAPASAGLAGFLAERLPPYMVPARFVVLGALPMTPSGKIDRKALPNPFDIAIPAETDVPATTLEALAAIWRDILALPEVNAGDDFFDLGGYSLLTVRLQRRIEERFGRILELPALMRSSTLAAMAALIDSEDDAPANGVIPLNRPGKRPTLFWLDAGPLMREMARAIDGEQPVATLNTTRADEAALGDGPLDLAKVASLLRKRLVRAQPHGPYYIGGWCRWGVVAHELACQLRERGRPVGLLVLLDADAPRTGFAPLGWLRRLAAPRRAGAEEPPSFSQRVEIAARHRHARTFEGPALLLRPIEAQFDSGHWRSHIDGRLTIEGVPGDHVSMVRPPHVAALAEAIDRHLLDAQASSCAAPWRGHRPAPRAQAPVMPR